MYYIRRCNYDPTEFNVCDGETGGVWSWLVATFSGCLVQSDLKTVVRNRH